MRTIDTSTELQEVSDTELVRRIAERDNAAAAQLLQRYVREITGFLGKRVDPADFDDLLQEVLCRILRSASSFRGDASVRTWLYSIARYTAWERNRSRGEYGSLCRLVDDGPGPESMILSRERRERLVAGLERLPDSQALVLELYRIDGLSHEEIASLLGISATASRKRLERAVRALDSQLESGSTTNLRHLRIESWRESLMRRIAPAAE